MCVLSCKNSTFLSIPVPIRNNYIIYRDESLKAIKDNSAKLKPKEKDSYETSFLSKFRKRDHLSFNLTQGNPLKGVCLVCLASNSLSFVSMEGHGFGNFFGNLIGTMFGLNVGQNYGIVLCGFCF